MSKKQIIALAALIILTIFTATVGPANTSGEINKQQCPPSSPDGAYFKRGIDKEGQLLCGFAYYDECPHAANYSATSIECQKLQEQNQEQPTKTNTEALDVQIQSEGK